MISLMSSFVLLSVWFFDSSVVGSLIQVVCIVKGRGFFFVVNFFFILSEHSKLIGLYLKLFKNFSIWYKKKNICFNMKLDSSKLGR